MPDTARACWEQLLTMSEPDADLLARVEHFARTNNEPCRIAFGTSGWRGEIGSDFTFNNVRIATLAIIDMCRQADAELLAALGAESFADIQRRGFIVGHDNRFLGPDFARSVIGLLKQAGIRTYYAGEAITPEFATALSELNAACSVNLTPSHNPANYSGFKFNPADGGPAGREITSVIEELANARTEAGEVIPDVPADADDIIDPGELYETFVRRRGTIDLDAIRQFVATGDLCLVIDHVHGATRGRPQRLLPENVRVRYLRTADNPLFGGVKPEPSSTNMEAVTAALGESDCRFKLGVIMDPDGDRVRFTDGDMEVPMNVFGALAFYYLYRHREIRGIVAKSVATSNFANAIARGLGVPVEETSVGFKNFRPFLRPDADPAAIVAFEESDGISGYRHTLDKDAMFGLLLAIEMVSRTGLNLGDYVRLLQQEYGAYYPERSGIEVDRELAGAVLKEKIAALGESCHAGQALAVGEELKSVEEVNTADGVKVVFEDGSWLLVRPSGTEPKVRFYVETRSAEETSAMFALAEKLTRDALAD